MKAINAKSSNVVTRVALPIKLERIAAAVAGAMQETVSLSETLGTLTRDAGVMIVKRPDLCDPFVDACRQLCEASGLTDGSFKVYMSNIRGVIRAMVEGYKPKDGQSLRAMYDAAPKGTGRQKAGARASKANEPKGEAVESDDSDDAPRGIPVRAGNADDARRAAITVLFGHYDDELEAAMAWAVKNEMSLIAYVKANVRAASAPAAAKVSSIAPAVSAKAQSTAPAKVAAPKAKKAA